MSLSDSDDDCYGNAAKKLQSLKEKYVPVKFDDVIPLESLCSSTKALDECNKSLIISDDDELTLEAIIANNTIPKRGRKRKVIDKTFEPCSELPTRSRRTTRTARNAVVDDGVPSTDSVSEMSRRRKRGRSRRGNNLETSQDGAYNTSKTASSTRGRNNARGHSLRSRGCNNARGHSLRSRSRGRNSTYIPTVQEFLYPTYTIGDFGNYPDTCSDQQLFSSKPTNDIEIIEEDDPLENDNEELSVKVYWQSTQVIRFKIRRFQKLTQIFKYFTEKENIDKSNLLLMYNDKVINIDDTPDTINYNIAEFIEGGIVSQDVSRLAKQNRTELNTIGELTNGFIVKFQCQNFKKPFETKLRETDKLGKAITLCAEHLEVPVERLKFYFDGDLISSKMTPNELGMESGDCIDVKILS